MVIEIIPVDRIESRLALYEEDARARNRPPDRPNRSSPAGLRQIYGNTPELPLRVYDLPTVGYPRQASKLSVVPIRQAARPASCHREYINIGNPGMLITNEGKIGAVGRIAEPPVA